MCDALKELFAEELKEENERGMECGIERGRSISQNLFSSCLRRAVQLKRSPKNVIFL